MQNIVFITPDVAVTGQLDAADIAEVARLGFRSIVNNRVENEEDDQLPSLTEAALARRHAISYRHVPAGKLDLFTDPVIEGIEDALANLPKPMLLHCKSGMRSAIVWAAAAARHQPVDEVLTRLEAAGYELDFLRDELDAQADRHRWMPAPTPAVAADDLAA